jgi:poly(3-hydroxybutyrate) depolymerase
MALRLLARVLLMICVFLPPAFAGKVQTKSVRCNGKKITYLLSVPANGASLPAVLLLHGAGDRPEPMMEAWSSLAERERIVLIAPELPRTEEFESMASGVFHCVVEDAKGAVSLDAKRVYVFGNSMGGYLAYDALAFDSEYFAAAGVHAMGIAPEYDTILDHATRKMPVTIYIGDSDPFVSLKSVRRTVEVLKSRGFAVRFTELKNHDHNYYAISAKVNADAWEFFLGQHLP